MGSVKFRSADDLQLLLLGYFSLNRTGGDQNHSERCYQKSQNLNPVK